LNLSREVREHSEMEEMEGGGKGWEAGDGRDRMEGTR
jgi:hypothetical protein